MATTKSKQTKPAAPPAKIEATDQEIAETLEALHKEALSWEGTEFTTSNARLYGILTGCYILYRAVVGKAEMINELDRVLGTRGITVQNNTKTETKIIRFVFGVGADGKFIDRRRISAYATTLRIARAEKVEADDLPSWIAGQGGIEEVRRQKSSEPKIDAQVDKSRFRQYALASLKDAKPLASFPKSKDTPEGSNGFVLLIGSLAGNNVSVLGYATDKDDRHLNALLETEGKRLSKLWDEKKKGAAVESSQVKLHSVVQSALAKLVVLRPTQSEQTTSDKPTAPNVIAKIKAPRAAANG